MVAQSGFTTGCGVMEVNFIFVAPRGWKENTLCVDDTQYNALFVLYCAAPPERSKSTPTIPSRWHVLTAPQSVCHKASCEIDLPLRSLTTGASFVTGACWTGASARLSTTSNTLPSRHLQRSLPAGL